MSIAGPTGPEAFTLIAHDRVGSNNPTRYLERPVLRLSRAEDPEATTVPLSAQPVSGRVSPRREPSGYHAPISG
jgi:hypothetical protein